MEQEIIRLFTAYQKTDARDEVDLGIGDDGAILKANSRDTVWVTDTIVENVHFDLASCNLQQVGRKAMAVNLSDIAAMGASPVAALVTLVLPKSMNLDSIDQLAAGICSMSELYDVVIVGGDTNRHDGPLMVGVAISGSVDTGKAWRLDGAQKGDAILVTGKLGGSILGRHLDFLPRVELAQHIASNFIVHAATDISDSLAVDLGHLRWITLCMTGRTLSCCFQCLPRKRRPWLPMRKPVKLPAASYLSSVRWSPARLERSWILKARLSSHWGTSISKVVGTLRVPF